MNLVNMAMTYLGPVVAQQVASRLGLGGPVVNKLIAAALPAILGSVLGQSKSSSGLGSLMGMLTGSNRPQSDMLGSIFQSGGDVDELARGGQSSLENLFGGEAMGLMSGALGRHAGVDQAQAGTLMGMIAPAALGSIADQVADQQLDGPGLASFLDGQAANVAQAMPAEFASEMSGSDLFAGLSSNFGSMAGSASNTIGAMSGAAAGTVGAVVGSASAAATGALGSAADGALGTVGAAADAASGAVGSATGAIGSVAGAATGAVGAATGAVADRVGAAADAATGTVSAAASRVGDAASAGASMANNEAKKGMGFLPWIIGIGAIALGAWYFLGGTQAPELDTGSIISGQDLTVGGVDLGSEFGNVTTSLNDTFSGITDQASAEAALPQLEQISGQLGTLGETAGQLTGTAKTGFQGIVGTAVSQLKPIIEGVIASSGAGAILQPVVDQIFAALEGMAG